MLITNAYAQAVSHTSNGTSFITFVPFILIFAIMYFLIIRPQRAQMKKRQEMLNAVRRGDTVITGGGILGKVTKVYDESGELEVEISEGIRIRVIRSTLADVRIKGEPLSEEKSKPSSKIKAPKTSESKVEVKKSVSAPKVKKVIQKKNKPKT
ncbi:protein translocase subunit yajC [Bartonella sp. CDC_skunk]|uniref:preprotein translocase subunit YajC n=1 Tax=unclassified Bartonella TaxID=2645622 RepID=UPI00099ADF91|nr:MULTISPECIES: preprotein translocase subunit YajC [unclassified Bartonella]AQX18095.1 protein translocase subunit yajC [Bartonella sp. A1379B]AQX21026.1 protein translocase subunit yajC [Bartonella sp. CDC_skunk]AQX22609.1 preprotein translocase subunit YajC [Bartonella sp. 11B]AQX24108.1 preprotein translocase subunit YajC [Bartonella sp. 114]AQX25058.1 protein translocase subunit yajC [Bartonella sp. Coyote22sub2]